MAADLATASFTARGSTTAERVVVAALMTSDRLRNTSSGTSCAGSSPPPPAPAGLSSESSTAIASSARRPAVRGSGRSRHHDTRGGDGASASEEPLTSHSHVIVVLRQRRSRRRLGALARAGGGANHVAHGRQRLVEHGKARKTRQHGVHVARVADVRETTVFVRRRRHTADALSENGLHGGGKPGCSAGATRAARDDVRDGARRTAEQQRRCIHRGQVVTRRSSVAEALSLSRHLHGRPDGNDAALRVVPHMTRRRSRRRWSRSGLLTSSVPGSVHARHVHGAQAVRVLRRQLYLG